MLKSRICRNNVNEFKYGRSSCCGSNCDGMLSELYQKENDTAERLFIFAKTKISVLRCGLRHIIEDDTSVSASCF